MRPYLIYFAFPYTVDPAGCTAKIKEFVKALIEIRKDIAPFIPHIAFDGIFDVLPTGYSHFYMLCWEFEIISRCDAICFAPTDIPSSGVHWEEQFAIWYGVPIVAYEDLLEGKDMEDLLNG